MQLQQRLRDEMLAGMGTIWCTYEDGVEPVIPLEKKQFLTFFKDKEALGLHRTTQMIRSAVAVASPAFLEE